MQIDASELTTFEVSPDGRRARINLRDLTGEAGSVVLPIDCMTRLLMTLPAMIQMALRNLHGNDTLRLVHALRNFRVEVGEMDAAGVQQFILTLATNDGFSVAFSASGAELESIGDATREEMPLAGPRSAASRLM